MAYFAHSGLPGILDLLENLSEASDIDRFAHIVTSGLRPLAACDVVLYQEIVPSPTKSVVVADPSDAVPADLGATLSRYRHQHPLIAHPLRTADPRPRRLSDLASRGELRHLPVYHHVLHRKGREYQASVPLAIGRDAVTSVALLRGDRDFSRRDLALLELLRPHLVSAHQRACSHASIGSIDAGARVAGAAAASRRRRLEAHGLTSREAEVMMLVAEGMTNAGIASELGITVRTVKKHLERVFSKLGVDNRTTAAAATLWRPARTASLRATEPGNASAAPPGDHAREATEDETRADLEESAHTPSM